MEQLGPYLLGPNDTEENGIYCGDARVLSEAIPDESVDLIFTDPVYDRIDDYRWLAECGARVLKEDRACLVWLSKSRLAKILKIMIPKLNYAWIMENHRVGASNFGRNGKLITKLEGCLWMEKGNSKPYDFVWDYHKSNDWPKFHALGWNKSESCLSRWVYSFSENNATILDPFTGGGTVPAVCKMLGRKYLAFEIDADTCQLARERVRKTQPPLFTLEPEQTRMEI